MNQITLALEQPVNGNRAILGDTVTLPRDN